jgi:hypothetical protein
MLAIEGEGAGWEAFDPGLDRFVPLNIPACAEPLANGESVTFAWTALLSGHPVRIEAAFRRISADGVALVARLTPQADLEYPHFSYGLNVLAGGVVPPFQWTHSPSHCAFSYRVPALTLWLISTYDHEQGVQAFDGCQSAGFSQPSPERLRFFLRTPPGYTAKSVRRNLLAAGGSMVLRGVLRVSPGAFYADLDQTWSVQPLEPNPPRYSYREYLAPITAMFRDPKKYVAEGAGLIAITAIDGRPDAQCVQKWTRGPGFGGAWDCENGYNLLLYEDLLGPTPAAAANRAHARRLLDGWLRNPDYFVPPHLRWRQPGDMRDSYICSRWMPDFVWSAHQGTTMHWLAGMHRLAGWPDALEAAQRLAAWVVRNQSPNGSIPSLWQFHVDLDDLWRPDTPLDRQYEGQLPAHLAGMLPCDARPPVTRTPVAGWNRAVKRLDCQPASCAPLVTGLLSLQARDGNPQWLAAARRLADYLVGQLAPPLADYGCGEIDYLIRRQYWQLPTGTAAVVWFLADALQTWGDTVFGDLLHRYARILLAQGALYEPHLELLRPLEKLRVPPYDMDLKIAGGFTHGPAPVLMNRNEMAIALLRAWQATGGETYRRWLVAYLNWQTYFQFTREVPDSLVTCLGSCPQNHPWTDDRVHWNNDYGTTAMKSVGVFAQAVAAGLG